MNNNIRLLQPKDNKDFFNIINYFTQKPEEISKVDFLKQLKLSKSEIYVLEEDPLSNKFIGTGSIFIDYKFQHNLSKVAYIDNVIIHPDYRGQGYGKQIISKLVKVAKDNQCYKVILDCYKDTVKFYEKCGFEQKQVQMSIFLCPKINK